MIRGDGNPNFAFRISGLGFRISDFRSRVSGFGFRVSASAIGFRASDFPSRASDLRALELEWLAVTVRSAQLWLWWRLFTWRHWRRAPRSTLVLGFILALGVGVFLAIRLANRAAVAGFGLFGESVMGESDLVVVPRSGELPETALPELRAAVEPLSVAFFPVLETTASEPAQDATDDGFNAVQYRIVGVDLVSLANLVYFERWDYRPPASLRQESDPAGESQWRLGAEEPQIFVSAALAHRRALAPGKTLDLIVNDRRVSFEVVGVLPEPELRVRAPADLLLMDLPAVQRLVGRTGWVERVEVRLPKGEALEARRREVEQRLARAAVGRWEVEAPETQRAGGEEMTKAFRLNLTILSGLALLLAVYLIVQALEAAVARRRSEIAVLRSLGVRPQTIRLAWQAEALVLGLAGSLGGLALGWLGAQLAVGAVARTVNSLYFSTTTAAAGWNWGETGFALLVGVLASGIAGWLPARDAALTPPAETLQRGVRFSGRPATRARVGWLFLALGTGLYWAPAVEVAPAVFFPLAGYAAGLCWVLGAGWLMAPALAGFGRVLKRVGAGSALVTYAASQLCAPSGRHRLATAGLMVAVSMASGMSLLIRSFDTTMVGWIGQALRADLYVACQGVGNGSSRNRLSTQTWQALFNDPDVAMAEVGQVYPIQLEGANTLLVGGSLGERSGWRYYVWVEPPDPAIADLIERDGVYPVLVSESFLTRFRKARGDRMRIPTPAGEQAAAIAGVFADYGNERGSIVARREYVARWFNDDRAISVAAYLKPGVDPEAVRNRWLAARPELMVRTNRRLRSEVMTVFHQTFAVTYALQWIGLTVAVVGQALALISILLERPRELATLKELGLTRRRVARAVAIEGVGMAGVGVGVGLALSVALGHLLIYVVNKQSFGWTLAFRIPGWDMLMLAVLVLAASAVVSYRVGQWSARLPSDREE